MEQPNLTKWMRRTHLYAGLFLAPWVLMYGMSGFIFNHGELFVGDDPNQRQWSVAPSAAAQRLDADALARKVVGSLNERTLADDGASTWQLLAESTPRFEGAISLEGTNEQGGSVLLVLEPDRDQGWTIRRPPAIAARHVALDAVDAELLRAAREAVVTSASAAASDLREVRFGDASFPALVLQLERDGSRQRASYDLRSGELTLTDPPARGSMKPTAFLTSLHTSHGYPGDPRAEKVRTARALFVDVMACVMCFWALSGLAMWWQMKPLRRSGLAVIVATLIVVGLVWGGMYRLFTGGG